MCILGYNAESFLVSIKNLTQFEFGKALLNIRKLYSESDELSDLLTDIIDNYDLSKKEIRTIISETQENNEEFLGKLERSIEANKNDASCDLARKLEKHCKRESTENSDKQEQVKMDHIYNLLSINKLKEICADLPRIVLFLDNAKAHKTDLVKDIAKILNIYLLHIPKYSPDLAPVELVFKIIKDDLKNNKLKSKKEVLKKCLDTFEAKCKEYGIYGWFLEKYLPFIN